MNIASLHVRKGLVANSKLDKPQLMRVSVATTNIDSNTATELVQCSGCCIS